MTPLGNRVFIRPAQRPSITEGGLVIPETVSRPAFAGVIVAAGPTVTDVKVDDVVIFGLFNGQEHVVGGVLHYVMRETDVLAVLEGA